MAAIQVCQSSSDDNLVPEPLQGNYSDPSSGSAVETTSRAASTGWLWRWSSASRIVAAAVAGVTSHAPRRETGRSSLVCQAERRCDGPGPATLGLVSPVKGASDIRRWTRGECRVAAQGADAGAHPGSRRRVGDDAAGRE